MERREYKGERMIHMRHVEIHHIQELLMKRGRKYDWMIIHIMSNQMKIPFNNGRTTVTKREQLVDLKIRELQHIQHLLFTNRSPYNTKILDTIEEETFMPYKADNGCFCDYQGKA